MTSNVERKRFAHSMELGPLDYLNSVERARLQDLANRSPHVAEALAQLGRILVSAKFERVQQKARDLLGFVVAKTLLGDENQIKQTSIAIRVFGESAEFDPLENSKVRVAGLALRKRLATYYADEGRNDSIEIAIPIGTYIPRIHFARRS